MTTTSPNGQPHSFITQRKPPDLLFIYVMLKISK